MTLDALLDRFTTQYLEAHRISAKRCQETLSILRVLAGQIAPRELTELEPGDIMDWQASELQRGIAAPTIGKRRSEIHAFLTWAEQAEVMSWELTSRLKSVRQVRGHAAKKPPRPYSRTEIEHLREKLQQRYPLAPKTGKGSNMLRLYVRGRAHFRGALRYHALRLQWEAQIALALECGLRSIEVYEIKLAAMHPDNIGVVVESAKQGPDQKRERMVPYTEHARLVIREWLDFRSLMNPPHDRPWLAMEYGDGQTPQAFHAFKKSMGQRFGYEWHRLRHTFATERLKAGMPLEQVQRMLGHTRVETTLCYAEIANSDIQANADRTEAKFAEALGLPTAA